MAMELPKSWRRMLEETKASESMPEEGKVEPAMGWPEAIGKTINSLLMMANPAVAAKEALGGENVIEQAMGKEPRKLSGLERVLSGLGALPGGGKAIAAPIGIMKMLKSLRAARKVIGKADWAAGSADRLAAKVMLLPQKEWSRISELEFDPNLVKNRSSAGLFSASRRTPIQGKVSLDPVWADARVVWRTCKDLVA